MKKLVTLTIGAPDYEKLHSHLFSGDRDEHGAVLAVGISEDEKEIRLLVRNVFLARDGIDYVPGTRGYRALTAAFVAEKSGYCADRGLGYLAVHCHGGIHQVEFSGDDLSSQDRGYPALMDITDGGPVGALVFAEKAVAGRIWFPNGQILGLDHLKVISSRIFKLYPQPVTSNYVIDPVYDRSARIFGDLGQHVLGTLRVGIIGLGGVGSLVNEWLARLGVGEIIAVDFDKIEITNLPRVVGATRWDTMSFLTRGGNPKWLRDLGSYVARYKVDIARRVAKQARPAINYKALRKNVVDLDAAEQLKNADFIFLAADSMQSRLVFNALVHQYLIPGAQIGVKVSLDPVTKKIADVFTVNRIVLPFAEGGCLQCHGLISSAKLQEESLSSHERRAQRYVDSEEVPEPSVITLNVLASAQAVTDFMMMFTGLYEEDLPLPHIYEFVDQREIKFVDPVNVPNCIHCSDQDRSSYARGDRSRLPCRERNPG